jgi:predicted TIM-barrel fold metal-dependent hydrolase
MIQLSGLAAELFKEIKKLPVIDTHEHLYTEKERTARKIDALWLFSHYCRADLETAGLKDFDALFERHELLDSSKPVLLRWKKIRPYFEAVRYGGYAYTILAYVRDILGFEDLNDSTVQAISDKLQADNKPGHYKKIIRNLCNIEKSIQCKDDKEDDIPGLLVYLCRDRVTHTVYKGKTAASFKAKVEFLEEITGLAIHSLEDFSKAIGAYISERKKAGCVGVKVGVAYSRTLDFSNVASVEADRVFVRAMDGMRPNVDNNDLILLENWLMRRQVEACIEVDMPVVIHTGYQAGLRNDIRNARATLLFPLIRDYKQARFDLFHGSFPYTADMMVLGKYFPNVWLNMCWMHIMSPEVSQRALAEWMDTVPVNKIFAFGGDNRDVEHIYGHLELARANIAKVLAGKITEGRMGEKDVIKIARLLLYENPKKFYGL